MSEHYWQDDMVTLHLGDCAEVLAGMEPASVDAVVTDPPYGLEFMGKDWDIFPTGDGFRRSRNLADVGRDSPHGRASGTSPEFIAGRPFQHWCEQWAAECLRVLKPGGHLLAFGGTRTYHRLACGIEDAGFEVRDSMHWIYGSGFPKSLDVSKAIDKAAGAEREVAGKSPDSYDRSASSWQADDGRPHGMVGRAEGPRLITIPATDDAARWQGWGTALKPAHEPIIVARKPLAGTVAANVLEHGSGALNIQGCRVGAEQRVNSAGGSSSLQRVSRVEQGYRSAVTASEGRSSEVAGRWPSNVLLGPDAAAEMDRQSGASVSSDKPRRNTAEAHNRTASMGKSSADWTTGGHADRGGASRFFPVFRYEPKAATAARPRGEDGTAHPTVKPVGLMQWLVRLVTPPGGVVLDPFGGSGTTAEACIIEGFRSVLIEKDPAYAELIRTRLRKPIQPDMFGGVA